LVDQKLITKLNSITSEAANNRIRVKWEEEFTFRSPRAEGANLVVATST